MEKRNLLKISANIKDLAKKNYDKIFQYTVGILVVLWMFFLGFQHYNSMNYNKLFDHVPYNAQSYISLNTNLLKDDKNLQTLADMYIQTKLNFSNLRLKDLLETLEGSISFVSGGNDKYPYFFVLANIKSKYLLQTMIQDLPESVDIIMDGDLIIFIDNKDNYYNSLGEVGKVSNDRLLSENLKKYQYDPFYIYVNEGNKMFGHFVTHNDGYKMVLESDMNFYTESNNTIMDVLPQDTIVAFSNNELSNINSILENDFIEVFGENAGEIIHKFSGASEAIIIKNSENNNKDFLFINKNKNSIQQIYEFLKIIVPQNIAKNFPIYVEKVLPDNSIVNELVIDPSLYKFEKLEIMEDYVVEQILIDDQGFEVNVIRNDEFLIFTSSYELAEMILDSKIEHGKDISILQKNCLATDKDYDILPYIYMKPSEMNFDDSSNSLVNLLTPFVDELIFIIEENKIFSCIQ